MLITVNAHRRQTHTHACPKRGQSVTQTRCMASQRDSQISPDQSPSAISASQSLLTQLPHPHAFLFNHLHTPRKEVVICQIAV